MKAHKFGEVWPLLSVSRPIRPIRKQYVKGDAMYLLTSYKSTPNFDTLPNFFSKCDVNFEFWISNIETKRTLILEKFWIVCIWHSQGRGCVVPGKHIDRAFFTILAMFLSYFLYSKIVHISCQFIDDSNKNYGFQESFEMELHVYYDFQWICFL